MKTYKYITILISFLIVYVVPMSAQQDSKAKEYFEKSSKAFTQAGNMSIDFTINIKDTRNKVTESFDGIINLKEQKFHLDIPEMETWFDGKTQWVLQKDWGEVTITQPNESEIQAINPTSIFEVYKSGCNYKYIGEKTNLKGQKVYEVELTPQSKKSEMTKIIMQINAGDFMPSLLHIVYKNNMENVIHLNKYRKNLKLKDDLFVFDAKKYSNVEIIDLR